MELDENEQITDKEYTEEGERLKTIAATREYEIYSSPIANTSFLIESFCTQVAWLGKSCPMYPYLHDSPKSICKFLTDDNHPGYRCPATMHLEDFLPIVKKGTPEQKKALETLADISVKYSLFPPNKESEDEVKGNRYLSLAYAVGIYEMLGLAEKAKFAEEELNRLNKPSRGIIDYARRQFVGSREASNGK